MNLATFINLFNNEWLKFNFAVNEAFEVDDGIICVSNKLEVMLVNIKENNYEIIQSIEKTIIKTVK